MSRESSVDSYRSEQNLDRCFSAVLVVVVLFLTLIFSVRMLLIAFTILSDNLARDMITGNTNVDVWFDKLKWTFRLDTRTERALLSAFFTHVFNSAMLSDFFTSLSSLKTIVKTTQSSPFNLFQTRTVSHLTGTSLKKHSARIVSPFLYWGKAIVFEASVTKQGSLKFRYSGSSFTTLENRSYKGSLENFSCIFKPKESVFSLPLWWVRLFMYSNGTARRQLQTTVLIILWNNS